MDLVKVHALALEEYPEQISLISFGLRHTKAIMMIRMVMLKSMLLNGLKKNSKLWFNSWQG